MTSLTRDMQAFADHYRVASFFDGARAARDDIAYGAYPSLGSEPLTAPVFHNGEVIGRADVRIIGKTIPGAYVVQSIRVGNEWIAFASEIHRH